MTAPSSARPDPNGLLGVVVVNYASSGLLQRAVKDLPHDQARVIVVDNFSGLAERETVRILAAERGWALVEMADNTGFGPAVNAGVDRAVALNCVGFLLLNPDTEVSAETVAQLRLTILAEPRALVSPCLVDRQGTLTFAGSVLSLTDGRVRRASAAELSGRHGPHLVVWFTAACLAVSRELWCDAQGFSEDYFMYWEDVDFSYRCTAIGARMLLRTDLQVQHDQGGTQGPRRGRAKSPLYYYYNIRNRLLFASLHLPPKRVLRWLAHTPAVSWEILLRGGRRQLVWSPRLAWVACRGAMAGAQLVVRSLSLALISRSLERSSCSVE